MSLLSRLFGKAPVAVPAATASPAVAARSGETRSLQEAEFFAVSNLEYGDPLLSAASDATQPARQRAAQRRLAQLIDTGNLDFARFCRQVADKGMLLAVAAASRDSACLEQAAVGVDDPELYFRLATEGSSTRLRQLAAEKVDDPVRLKELLKHVRGKDKNVFKIVRRKCDQINATQRQAQQVQLDITALGESIERHSHKPFDGAFIATVEHLNAQWKALADQAPPELVARVTQAIERSGETIASHLRAVAAQAAQTSAMENADVQRRAVLDDLRGLLASLLDMPALLPAASEAARQQFERWNERWKDSEHYKPASSEQAAAFESLRSAAAELLRLTTGYGTLAQQMQRLQAAEQQTAAELASARRIFRQTLSQSNELQPAEQPGIVETAAELLQQLEARHVQQEEAAAAALRQVGGLIRKASRALDEGRSRQARGLRRAIDEALTKLSVTPGHINGQLEQLDSKLKELQDWKRYAVAPKRTELIEQMQALVGMNEAPTELAERIQRLQEEWKSLTKGSDAQADPDSEADWQRFHQAAQEAYQPCREHFATQARIRQENLDKRRQLVEQLARFEHATDWAQPDWREVARKLRNARQEWRQFSPTDRAATKPVQEAFDALLNKLQGRLDAEYSTNIDRKKSLIQQARRLNEESDTRKAIDAAKRLQAAWKSAGAAPRAEDQKLWEEFRQQCDEVYRRSQQEYEQLVAELDANKAKAIALCEAAETLAGKAEAQLFEGAPRMKELRESFDALGELPRSEAQALGRRFARAMEHFEFEVAQQRSRDEQRRWDDLFTACNEIRLLQLASLESADPATDPAVQVLRASVRDFIDGVSQWPKGGLVAIEEKFIGNASPDPSANETAMRTLCVRAEILTDAATPTDDQPLRREYQLQSLVRGLGRSAQSAREQMQAMVFEWIAIGPVPTAAYMDLLQRFRGCWGKVKVME